MNRRKERETAYLREGAGPGPLAFDLVVSAQETLVRALEDRRGQVVRLAANHYSPNAVATIVLVATALDVSMNEAIATGDVFGTKVDRKLALLPTCTKFAQSASGGSEFEAAAMELRLLVDVRDEIVHYLPRSERSSIGNLPSWCQSLHERGLFIAAPGSDFQFSQKIPSYALAYWAHGVAYRTLENFVSSLPTDTREVCDYLVHNMGLYEDRACAPERLAEYDATYSLTLTEFDPVPTPVP